MVYLFNIGFYRGSIKEIVIIDDEIEEEEEIQESDNESEFRERFISCEEFNKIMVYSEKVCNDFLREFISIVVEEFLFDDKEVIFDDIV